MSELHYIYKLIDPNTLKCRYVGKSNNPESRLKQHISEAKYDCANSDNPAPKSVWIKLLLDNEQIPIVETVEHCQDSIVLERERYWIGKEVKAGSDLTNLEIAGRGKYKPARTHKKVIASLDYDTATWLRRYAKQNRRLISAQVGMIIKFYIKEKGIDIHDETERDLF